MSRIRADHNSVLLHLSSCNKTRQLDDNANCDIAIYNPGYTNNITKMIPLMISIPNMFNNVADGHDSIRLFTDPHIVKMGDIDRMLRHDGNGTLIQLPHGNYNMTELVAALGAELTKAAAGLTVAYDAAAKRITFANSGAHEIVLTQNETSHNDIRLLLGLADSTVIPAGGTASGVAPPKLAFVDHVFVHSHRLCQARGVSVTNESLLDVVPLTNVPYGSMALTECKTDNFCKDIEFHTDTERLQDIDIQLTDQHMRQLSLPFNYHWNILLKCWHRGP